MIRRRRQKQQHQQLSYNNHHDSPLKMTGAAGVPHLSLLFLLVMIAVVVMAAVAAEAAGTTNSYIQDPGPAADGGGIINIPLIPHHAHLARTRRELLLIESEEEDEVERPTHYHRDLQGNNNNNNDDVDSGKTIQVASLFQGYGTHYADLWCGTPPQRQTVIVDTGSGVTAFPCHGCSDCGVPTYHIDALFDSTQSSTYRELECGECLRGSCSGGKKCRIGMSYQEGSSWNAIEVRDKCYVGGMHDVAVTPEEAKNRDDLNPFNAASFAFPLNFGCQDRVTGLFKTQLADGIMGMDNAKASFWAQMSQKKGLKRLFSLCFSRSPIASREGTNAGAMTLGGYDKRFHSTPLLFTGTGKGGSGFYGVTVRNMFLKKSEDLPDESEHLVSLFEGNTRLMKGIKAIVDSGTTDSYFERSLSGTFNKVWNDMIGTPYGHGNVELSDEQLKSLPTIVLQIAGDVALNQGLADVSEDKIPGLVGEALDPEHPYDILIHVPPQHYMEYNAKNKMYSARFYVDEGGGGSVFGANLMMGHNVFFDVDNNIIGWAQSDCDYEGLVQPFVDEGALVPNENSKTTRQENNDGKDSDKDNDSGGDKSDTKKKNPDKKPSDETTEHDKAEPPADSTGTAIDSSDKSGLCESSSCKFTASVIALSALTVFIIGGVLLHRRSSRRYQVTGTSELELQAGPPAVSSAASNDSDDGIDFGNVRYRDHVAEQDLEKTPPSDDNSGGGAYLVDPDGDGEGGVESRGVLS